VLSGSSHLVGCRLSGCCRRSLHEKCQSRNKRRKKVCGSVRDRQAVGERDFPVPDKLRLRVFGPPLTPLDFTLHIHISVGRQTFCIIIGVLIRSQLFATSCPPKEENADLPADGNGRPSDLSLVCPTSRPEDMGYTHHMCTGNPSLQIRSIAV